MRNLRCVIGRHEWRVKYDNEGRPYQIGTTELLSHSRSLSVRPPTPEPIQIRRRRTRPGRSWGVGGIASCPIGMRLALPGELGQPLFSILLFVGFVLFTEPLTAAASLP